MATFVGISVAIRKCRRKFWRKPPGDMWPLIWFIVAIYMFDTMLTLIFGYEIGFILAMSAAVGGGLLIHWRVTPALPKTLPGHLIRLVWSSAWPYYAWRRYSQWSRGND